MNSKDHTLGKKGRGILILLLYPPIFIYAGIKLLCGISKFEGQTGGSVALIYAALAAACLLYACYIAYCLFTLAKTARSIDCSGTNIKIIDYIGRDFVYTRDRLASIEDARLNFLLRNFFVFQPRSKSDPRTPNRLIKFSDGRKFLISARFDTAYTVLNEINPTP
ncbi:hypothetical protein [Seongchinamella sediminis]|uniref:hypothetical protein n=1 Tax=Seongchinamella sediminis TaxID=2283635 RepID=UPI001058A1C6|nr:hypothetical protein [Seongchinamella sediminis]